MKKILCFVLSFVMLVCAVSPAFAAEKAAQKDVIPTVIVPGIGSSGLYLNPNEENESSPLDLDFNSLINTVFKTKLISSTVKMAMGKYVNVNKWTNALGEVIKPFEFLGCDSDGNSISNIGINCYWEDSLANHLEYLDTRATAEPAVCKSISDEVGAENVWLFNYDARLDVIKDADKLSEFIDGVKEQSGKDKVNLVSCSLGTSVVSAYIDRYKDRNDINKTVFLDGAFQGVAVAKAFSKDFIINKDVVYNYLELLSKYCMLENADYGSILEIIKKFDKNVDYAIDFMQELSYGENLDNFYLKVILPIIGNMPSLWECIAYDDFQPAVDAMTAIGWLKEDSGLYKTIMEYHQIQGRLENNLKELQGKGVQVAIVCGYGLPSMPFTSFYNNQSDMLIDTCYASFGATVAPLDTKLDNPTSPDGYIDTSTCSFPENTWFLKGVQHMEFQYNTLVGDFIGYLCTTDTDMTVDAVAKDKENYTQFMVDLYFD